MPTSTTSWDDTRDHYHSGLHQLPIVVGSKQPLPGDLIYDLLFCMARCLTAFTHTTHTGELFNGLLLLQKDGCIELTIRILRASAGKKRPAIARTETLQESLTKIDDTVGAKIGF